MKQLHLIVASLLVLLLTSRCVREIQLDLPEEPAKLVAISHFTAGEPVRVKVTLSRPSYSAGDPETPSGANVTIARNGQFLDKLFFVPDGNYWQSRDTVQPEGTYSLAVRADGLPEVEASSKMPTHVPLAAIAVDWENIQVVPWDSVRRALRIPVELRPQWLPGNEPFFAFNLRHEIEVFQLVNGQPVPDYSYEGAAAFLTDGRTLSLLHNIPEPVVLIDEKFWGEDRQALRLDVLVPFDPATEKPRRLFVEWRTLSGEFYRYHLSLARQGDNLPLSDPDAVYNNVRGGYGNFSGYSVSISTIDLQF